GETRTPPASGSRWGGWRGAGSQTGSRPRRRTAPSARSRSGTRAAESAADRAAPLAGSGRGGRAARAWLPAGSGPEGAQPRQDRAARLGRGARPEGDAEAAGGGERDAGGPGRPVRREQSLSEGQGGGEQQRRDGREPDDGAGRPGRGPAPPRAPGVEEAAHEQG